MTTELENWACMELDKLGLPDAGVIIQYLGPLEQPEEVKEYLQSMLDMSKSSHKEFVKQFLEKQAESKVDKRFYRKKDDVEDHFSGRSQSKKKGGRGKLSRGESGSSNTSNEREQKSKNSNTSPDSNKENKAGSDSDKRISPDPPSQKGAQGNKKKKNKFVNLYTADNVELLSGRNSCECLASKHKLINNCLSCGRIVCEQEGAGPCFFCGNLVKAKHEADQISAPEETLEIQNNKKNGKGKQNKEDPQHMMKAIEHKNKLLEYDRTSEKRTKVLDDECDYFNSGSKWLSKEERDVLQAKEKEMKEKRYDRSNKKITIDLLGRQVIEEDQTPEIFDPEDPVVKAVLDHQVNDLFTELERQNLPPPSSLLKPIYVPSDQGRIGSISSPTDISNRLNRLQDKELQQISDQGKCLAMHQPWASLLISGIKIHEGRTWYTSHRGRLWISSAAKIPSAKEIEDLEYFYSLRNENVQFPKNYPPGCLLGCVDVTDVLPQEEYREKFPDGESDSPFVFICENPTEMIFKFPIKGQHKIFELDSKIHQAAKKALKI